MAAYASTRRVLYCLLFLGCREVSAGYDPLVKWISGLHIALPDFNSSGNGKAWWSLDVRNLVCSDLALQRVRTEIAGSVAHGNVGLALGVSGITAHCRGDFHAGGLLAGLGDGYLKVSIASGAAGGESLRSALNVPLDSKGVPQKVEVPDCRVDLTADVALGGNFAADLVHLFLRLIKVQLQAFVQTQISHKVCAQLEHAAATNLTQFVEQLNRFLLPPKEHQMIHRELQQRVSRQKNTPSTVDWTKVPTLAWGHWLVNDFLGIDGLNNISSWALGGESNLTLPGPAAPLVNVTIGAGDVEASALNVEVFLSSLSFDGMQSLKELSMQALDPDTLEASVAFGTAREPAVGFGLELSVKLSALDSGAEQSGSSVDEVLGLRIAFTGPRLESTVKLLCDASQWTDVKSMGQWYFDTENCAKSLLSSAPAVAALDVTFASLAEPLTFWSSSSGDLENDISKLLNNLVTLFNMVYEPYLPAAVSRFISTTGRKKLNDALGELQPTTCISKEAAEAMGAALLPSSWGNWPAMIDRRLHQVLSNVINGYIAANNTVLKQSLADMPPIPGLQQLKVDQIDISGLKRLADFELLITDDDNPQSLGLEARMECPSRPKPYNTSLVFNGSVAFANISGSGVLRVDAPCGSLSAKANILISPQQLLRTTFPPSSPLLCTLLPPSGITQLAWIWLGPGRLILDLGPASAEEVQPFAELCSLHPNFCSLLSKLASAIATPEVINHFFNTVKSEQCTDDSIRGPPPTTDKTLDLLGFRYFQASSWQLWLAAAFANLGLAIFLTILFAWLGPRRRSSLTGKLWTGTKWGKGATFGLALLMSTSLTLRMVAAFLLPYVTTVQLLVSKGGHTLQDQTLLTYTFLGMLKMFQATSPYCAGAWLLSSLLTPIAVFLLQALLLAVPLSTSRWTYLALATAFIARLPAQELETVGNTQLILNTDILLPMGLHIQPRIELRSGFYVAFTSTLLGILVSLLILRLHAASGASSEPDVAEAPLKRKRVQMLQLGGSAAILLGLPLFLFSSFMAVRFQGAGSSLLEPVELKGIQVGRGSTGMIVMFLAATCCAPVFQVAATLLSMVPGSMATNGLVQAAVQIGAAFNCADIFGIAYISTFIVGVGGFAQSTFHTRFLSICELLQDTVGQDCLVVDASFSPSGTFGIAIATAGSMVLVLLGLSSQMRASKASCDPHVREEAFLDTSAAACGLTELRA